MTENNPNAITITRIFNAPRERVWDAWTEPKKLMQWWGPKDFTSPVCKNDLREGGKYLYCMRSPDDKDFWSTGVYREIVKQERIVCTDSFADEKGNVVPATHYGMSDFPSELQVTVTFEKDGDGTRILIRHVGIPSAMKEMCELGWNQSLDKLAASLKR